jgi:hypothetical protein
MRRRSVLLVVGALAAGSGCSRVVGEDPVEVRVKRPETPHEADAICDLSDSFVAQHPVLDRVLESAATAPEGEWVVAGTDQETGEQLQADLHTYCEEPGGVYHYDEYVYRVRVQTNDGTTLTPAATSDAAGAPAAFTNTEAIRSGRADDSP